MSSYLALALMAAATVGARDITNNSFLLASGLLVHAEKTDVHFTITNATRQPANAAVKYLRYIHDTCENIHQNVTNGSWRSFELDQLDIMFESPCYYVQLCYLVNGVPVCATNSSERVEIERVYQPSDLQLQSVTATPDRVELVCEVPKLVVDHNVINTSSYVYEAYLECVWGCPADRSGSGSALKQRLNVSGSCNVTFDHLDDNASYYATLHALLPKSSARSRQLTVSFSTPLAPPASNPRIIGYEWDNSYLHLIFLLPTRAKVSSLVLNISTCSYKQLDYSDSAKVKTSKVDSGLVMQAVDQSYCTSVNWTQKVWKLNDVIDYGRVQLHRGESYEVDIVAQNAAGQWRPPQWGNVSSSSTSRAVISGQEVKSLVWATVDDLLVVVHDVDEKAALCWTGTVYVHAYVNVNVNVNVDAEAKSVNKTKVVRSVTIGSAYDCMQQQQLEETQTQAQTKQRDVSIKADVRGSAAWSNDEDQSDEMEMDEFKKSVDVQLDWIRCESGAKCEHVEESGVTRSSVQAASEGKWDGARKLAINGSEGQFGLALTLYDARSGRGREIYRTTMRYTQYGRQCTAQARTVFEDGKVHVRHVVSGDKLAVFVPVNNCTQGVWFVEYDVKVCGAKSANCTGEGSTEVRYPGLPGVEPAEETDCEAGVCRVLVLKSVPDLQSVLVRGRTLDGRVEDISLFTVNASVEFYSSFIFVLICCLFAVVLLLASGCGLYCFCRRKAHDRSRVQLSENPELRGLEVGQYLFSTPDPGTGLLSHTRLNFNAE